MESSRKDFIYSQNSYLNDYIQFADTKSAVFITINGLIMGFIYTQCKVSIPFKIEETNHFLLAICSILLLISYVFLFLVIFPRRKYKNGNSIVFWEDVSQYKNVDTYKKKVLEVEDRGFEEIMIEQNYYLSKTATKKYKNLHFSFIFSIVSYIILVVYGFLSVT